MDTSNNMQNGLVRVLGLKEAISMTIGTVVGVGLFTCGSSQIGLVGPWIIVFTLGALLISIWPCLIYGEMAAALPYAGGTYIYAKLGLNRVWANLAGWHYIVSVIAIGAGETLAFANNFTILMEQFGIDITWLDPRIIAIILVASFLILNLRGIEMSGKMQTAFMFFFWGCAVLWFLYMIPHVHMEYFGGFAMTSLPPFEELMYIFGLVWWCYTGFETCVSMGAEVKYPHYTLPRALKLSVFLVFAVNALFQWFLVGLVPSEFYGILATADAPYADGLKAVGLVGAPLILLCIGIAFGGDLSTINPGIAAPARYIYTMAEDHALPHFLSWIHPKYRTPHVAVWMVGIINAILIATGSIVYIASISLISLAVCYIIGCLAYLGLKRKRVDLQRPYQAPWGRVGCYFTIAAYIFMLCFADKVALLTAGIVTILCLAFYVAFTMRASNGVMIVEQNADTIKEPSDEEKHMLNREYAIWKYITIAVTLIAIGVYALPMIWY
ncbi:amino acid permease [Mitsuokella sp.]|uniref:APC family permease n=1 Tax=Mitsuokella sp. TaxID=2049034 RepID=UPI003D7CC86C